MNSVGTPKTLKDAIVNGHDESVRREIGTVEIVIEKHVRDYLSQKFSASLMLAQCPHEEKALSDLWFKITGKAIV